MLLWFTDEKISKFRTENLKNWPQITYSAPVAGTDRTRTQILSTLSIVLYWYLVSIFVNMCFSILNFLYKPSDQISRSVVSDSSRPHESQHARPPCPSPAPEFTQTHVHRVSDAIQPSHPLSSPSPPAPNPSQRQSLFPVSQLFA